jgi:dTDP-4-dehydrorhamnose reductase
MKILVTGSNGLLGQKLTEMLRNRVDITLIATGKGNDRYMPNTGYTYAQMDITNGDEVLKVIKSHNPDVVIHTAAMTNVDACELDKAGCDKLNISALEHIISATNAVHAHLIHLSTDFIFDGTHGPLREDEKPNPISYYGLSKWKGEQLVLQQSNSWAIIRTVLVYGVVKDMSRSNIVLWAKNSLEENKVIRVVRDQFRTPTLAEDLAMGCILAATQKATGIYHISGKEFMSVFDLVYCVADFWKLDKSLLCISSSEDINQPAKRPPITGFDVTKAISELGYKPHTFYEGLTLIEQQLTSKRN